MTLKEKINKNYIVAMKERNTIAKNLLSVVKGEIQTVEKNTGIENLSDKEVIKILTKTSKSLKEMTSSGSEQASQELAIIESYLPKQMTSEEITTKVSELINSGITQMGGIMKEFSSLPADKRLVSEIFKELNANSK